MIVQGKKGTYDCRVRQFGWSSACVHLYTPPKPKLFGLIPRAQMLLYKEQRAKHAILMEDAMEMTDSQRKAWFLKVIDWYETYHAGWMKLTA
jgi:hypothetical protein